MASDTVLVVVNVLASMTALYMCLSPAPAMHRIYKRQCTGHTTALPLVTQWAYNHVWMLYGFLTEAYFPLVATYAVGNLLSVVFLIVFVYATAHERRAYVLQLIAVALVFNIATTSYALVAPRVQTPHHVVQITGFVAIACGVALYASPLATIKHVVHTRNAVSMPIHMVAVGTLSNATWIVYGVLAHDWIIVCPTVVNTVLCIAQLLLYVAYRPPSRRKQAARSDSDSLSDSTCPESCSGCSNSNRNSSSSNSSTSGSSDNSDSRDDQELELSFVALETPEHNDAALSSSVADLA